jgi:DNA-binding LytR/AlgR family response regulator
MIQNVAFSHVSPAVSTVGILKQQFKNNSSMPYNCLVIDDDYFKSQELKTLLETEPSVDMVYNTIHPQQINRLLINDEIDVVFIKVKLWEHRLFTSVYALKKKPVIVFLSAIKEKYTEELFDEVNYHLREPYQEKNISFIFKRIVKEQPNYNWDFIFIKYKMKYHKVHFDDVQLVEKIPKQPYIKIHTPRGKFIVYGSIVSLLERLPEDRFIRIADKLAIPVSSSHLVEQEHFHFEGRAIPMTYQYMRKMENIEMRVMDFVE